MTKKEIIRELVDKYEYKESDLKNKKVSELNEILDNHTILTTDDSSEIEVPEVYNEVVTSDDDVEENAEVTQNENITISSYQLNIFETKVERLSGCKKVVFENIGAGDVYISESKNGIFKEDNRISPQTSKEFTNVDLLYVSSASRPVLKITYYR